MALKTPPGKLCAAVFPPPPGCTFVDERLARLPKPVEKPHLIPVPEKLAEMQPAGSKTVARLSVSAIATVAFFILVAWALSK